MVNTARQIGTVLGTAVMILLYQPVIDLNAFRGGWVFLVCAALAAALIVGATAMWRNIGHSDEPCEGVQTDAHGDAGLNAVR
jgi:hypothetical protein